MFKFLYVCSLIKKTKMKKILLSACAILVASATFAQSKMAELPKTIATEFTTEVAVGNPVLIPLNSAVAPPPPFGLIILTFLLIGP